MGKKVDLRIEQGATLAVDCEVFDAAGLPVDLTGYTGRFQIRQTVDSASKIVDGTTANGIVTVDEANGIVRIRVTDEATAAMNFTTAVHDLLLDAPDGSVSRLIEGAVTFSKGVTR